MSAFFFDSSAIVKRYLSEQGTSWVLHISDPASGNRIYLASITAVEVVSAITRKALGPGLSQIAASTAIARFRHDFDNQYQHVELASDLINQAMELAEHHALRGYDAVQLAAALQLHRERLQAGMPPVTLVSADAALNASATAEGVIVDDPNAHP